MFEKRLILQQIKSGLIFEKLNKQKQSLEVIKELNVEDTLERKLEKN